MKMTEQFQLVDIDKLVPYARNARTHSPEQVIQLQASIREFGFVNPVLIDDNYGIIAGHGRILAAKAEGLTLIPCVFVSHLTETQKKAYIIADNKLALKADWDMELLKLELDELKEFNFNIELTGFDFDEIQDITDTHDIGDAQEDDFEPEPPQVPVSMRGDVWILGKHRLMCGDSTSQSDVDILMDGKKAKAVFTDPPWNVDYGGDAKHPSWKARQILNDKMSTDDFGAFLCKAFTCMKQVSEPGCMTYIVMSAQEWGNLMDVMSAIEYHWSSTVMWCKDHHVMSRKDYHTRYEPIWYGWEGSCARLCPLEDRTQSDVWDIPRPKVSEEHPTMKPVTLVARALLNSSHSGDVVLDLFGGSGTTLIASEQTDRQCHMMELDPKYCDVIVKRYIEQVGSGVSVFLLRDGSKLLHSEVATHE